METTIEKKIPIPKELLKVYTEEKLDAFTDDSHMRVTWTTQDKRTIDIKELEDGHLQNLQAWLERNGHHRTWQIISCEVERRITGNYPEEFLDYCKKYRDNPEMPNLHVYMN